MNRCRLVCVLLFCTSAALSQAQQAVFVTPLQKEDLVPQQKAYFLKKDSFIKLDLGTELQEGPVRRIADEFKGITLTDINSVLVMNTEVMYFIKGDQLQPYYFAKSSSPAHAGPISRISSVLPGVWPDGVDAACLVKPGTAILFRGDEFILFDTEKSTVLKGTPAKIKDHFPDLWTENIGSAVFWKEDKVIFFKGREMIIWDLKENKKSAGPLLVADFWQKIWADGYDAQPKVSGAKNSENEPGGSGFVKREPTPEPKASEIIELDSQSPFFPKVKIKTAPTARTASNVIYTAKSMSELIDALPEWNKVYPKISDLGPVAGRGEVAQRIATVGKKFVTPLVMVRTPNQYQFLDQNTHFWLGGLVPESALIRNGRNPNFFAITLDADKRAPIKVSVDLLIPKNSEVITEPTDSKVGTAIQQFMADAQRTEVRSAREFISRSTDNHDISQAAIALGMDPSDKNFDLLDAIKGIGWWERTRRSVSFVFMERAFTASVDFEGRSGANAIFSNKFTMKDAEHLVEFKYMHSDNIPLYVDTITYGRVVVFTVTADVTESEIKAHIAELFENVTAGRKLTFLTEHFLKFQAKITVKGLGGPVVATEDLMRNGKLSEFFAKNSDLSAMKPISYTFRSVRENQPAKVAKSIEYDAHLHVPLNSIVKYKLWGEWEITDSDDGAGDNILECYGNIKLNGKDWWWINMPGENPTTNLFTTGDKVVVQGSEISVDTKVNDPESTMIQINGALYDRDGLNGFDQLGSVSQKVDIKALAESGEKITLAGRQGGARFTLRVVYSD